MRYQVVRSIKLFEGAYQVRLDKEFKSRDAADRYAAKMNDRAYREMSGARWEVRQCG